MANNGFGTGGFGNQDFEALARQYWNSWGEMMRNAAAAQTGGVPGMAGMSGIPGMGAMGSMPGLGGNAAAGVPGWNEAVAWWSQLAKGSAAPGANDAIDRFNSQARGWYAQMQQVASQFAGRDASPGDIVQAWKQALGGQGENPFAEMFRGMPGPGLHGFDQWTQQVAPYLQGFERWQRESQSMGAQPAFGFTREHQERWQELAKAQHEYQQHSQAYNTLMSEAVQDAYVRFEKKLQQRSEPGQQLESARALFDLWIDAAEDAYAEIALSPRFRDAYGAMVNAQMGLRGAMQREIEHATELLGIPSRTEVDAAHRKIVQIERELRRMRDAMGAAEATPGARPAPPPRGSGAFEASAPVGKAAEAGSSSKKPASAKSASKKAPSKKATSKKAISKKAPNKNVASKKVASKKATSKKAIAKPAATKTPAKATTPARASAKKAAPASRRSAKPTKRTR